MLHSRCEPPAVPALDSSAESVPPIASTGTDDPPVRSLADASVSVAQCSIAGHTHENRDVAGICLPHGSPRALRGATLAIADGVSTGPFGKIAAESTVNALLHDYYATPDTWSTGKAIARVVAATNSWLYMQGLNRAPSSDPDLTYLCTLSVLVLKGHDAHVFNIGDSRVYRLTGNTLEQLTDDHRVRGLSGGFCLSRAMGLAMQVEIDYWRFPVAVGDVFMLTTDGVHDVLDTDALRNACRQSDLAAAAVAIVDEATGAGADDDLTVQLARIDSLPAYDDSACRDESASLPIPPLLDAGARIDGFLVHRTLYAGTRSHVYLATDAHGSSVALKCPAPDLVEQADALERFTFEEWLLRRIESPHVISAAARDTPRTALYVATEHIAGTTLRQWLHDRDCAGLDAMRDIAEQLVRGLRALHRHEIIHQDLRPENVLIDLNGTVKIIDLGSATAAGIEEASPVTPDTPGGTWQYSAPEVLIGDVVSWRTDQFALGVVLYEILTGRLPYGAQCGRVRTRRDQRRLTYRSARSDDNGIPDWIDSALRRATHPDPLRRYDALSEFERDLRRAAVRSRQHVPLAERHPVRFWQFVSLTLGAISVLLALRLAQVAGG